MKNSDFSFFSLGGIGEIGSNCYVITVAGETFIIDMGLDFPENSYNSIGVMLPDLSILKDTIFDIKGIVFTHGHDDHIGAFPYHYEEIDAPIYASPFAAELIKQKLKEMKKAPIKELTYITEKNKKIKIGKTVFNFFRTKHSIPQSYGFYIETPFGNVVFTSDFKDIIDLSAIPQNPFILFSDSTNAESDVDIEDEEVDKTIRNIFETARGAIIATTFSSHIERIDKLIAFAKEYRKELFIIGKNIENTVSIAKRLGIINPPTINNWENIGKVPRDSILVITTGSQGERFSSLSLISKGTYRGFDIRKGDTIIVSSSIIPGNELNIYNMVNRFSEKGVDVYYARTSKIHSTGHGTKKVLKKVIKSLHPRYLVPIHGEARHLMSFKKMAMELGYKEDDVILLKNGTVMEVSNGSINLRSGFEVDKIFIDGDGGYQIDMSVIKERRKLSENGVVFVVVSITDGFYVSVETQGIFSEEGRKSFDLAICEHIRENIFPAYYNLENDIAVLKDAVTQAVKSYIKRNLYKKPIVFTGIVRGKIC